jgi:hypothetical protein
MHDYVIKSEFTTNIEENSGTYYLKSYKSMKTSWTKDIEEAVKFTEHEAISEIKILINTHEIECFIEKVERLEMKTFVVEGGLPNQTSNDPFYIQATMQSTSLKELYSKLKEDDYWAIFETYAFKVISIRELSAI